MNNEKTVYLIDGSAYIHRAYHAIPSLSNSEGFPTNAVFGFTRMLIKLIQERAPHYVAMFFDAKGPTFRHEIYEDYKANRPSMPNDLSVQIPFIKEITSAFNISIIEMPGYEADDLIGTFAHLAGEAGFSVVMVTADKDFMQLVTDTTIMWDPPREKTVDIATVRKMFGVEPRQLIDVMGLSGDSIDNVPGVPGIGQKTALNLIQTFGTLEGLYQNIDALTKKKQRDTLLQNKEQALVSKHLVTIDTAAPLTFDAEALEIKKPDNSKLAKLFKKLEFRQLQQAFPEPTDLAAKHYQSIQDKEALSALIQRLETAPVIAIDTETTSKDPMQAKLVGLSFSVKPDEAFYVPCGHDYPQAPYQISLAEVLEPLRPVLENPAIKKVGQNIKYDWMVLSRHGVHLEGVIFDTMIASYLINPTKRAHNLDQIALDFLDHKTITYQEITGKGNRALSFSQVPLENAVPYACEDADITLMAYRVLSPKLEEMGLRHLLETVEMPLVPVLMRMEMKGVCIDAKRLRQLSKSFEHQIEVLEGEIHSLAGETFNIKSSQQLGRILFEKLKLPVQKKTRKKTNHSTDVDVLTALAAHHELPALILRHRTLSKLKSTYTDALLDLANRETGRIHTSYNQTTTATGRLSSSDPNLQNIPIRTDEGREIRKAFIPQDGWHLLSADYSQIELRILAHYSEDEILMEAFKNREDIHTRTAAEVFQIMPSLVTLELRRQAKVINFGIIYGMSAYGLSQELGTDQRMAKVFIDNYFSRYKRVKEFIDRTIREAHEIKKTSTLLNRVRFLPDINSSNHNLRQFAERTAINTPIQGTAADLIKLAMIRIDDEIGKRGFKAAMLLTVHDELVLEVPHDELEVVKRLVKTSMEGIYPLRVPIEVNIAHGKNWDEAH
ncbi:MAG: DNA polymerase I [Deltaproteobacteria bacterium]|nr:DNA polymerase I [Deltaproteobacteria bacterium]